MENKVRFSVTVQHRKRQLDFWTQTWSSLTVFRPHARTAQRARAAYLSHSGVLFFVIIIVVDAEEEHPPGAPMLNSQTPCLGDWPTWLPLYII